MVHFVQYIINIIQLVLYSKALTFKGGGVI